MSEREGGERELKKNGMATRGKFCKLFSNFELQQISPSILYTFWTLYSVNSVHFTYPAQRVRFRGDSGTR